MKDKHKWGYNYSYMYSGLLNIHPTYGQSLSSSNRYTTSEVEEILTAIPEEKRSKFKNLPN